MTLAGTINYLYIKYKKPLAILVLIFFTYNIFNYCLKKYEGFSSNLHPRSRCSTYKNCAECVKSSNNCFWGDRDQKCSSIQLNGYGKICSGSNPNPNCPKCEQCPKLTLLSTPTFITQQ